jgi:hypothetical protein
LSGICVEFIGGAVMEPSRSSRFQVQGSKFKVVSPNSEP